MSRNHMDLQAIQSLASVYPVFPVWWIEASACACGNPKCASPGKHPIIRTGVLAATSDVDRINAWHETYPEANWGIACGGDSRLLVVDIDTDKDGEASWMRLTGGEWPDCPTVRTGSGGRHYYFRVPDGRQMPKNSAGAIAPGVDIRSTGGYVVAPGSRHLRGLYSWEEFEDLVPPDAPLWLLQLIDAKASVPSDQRIVRTAAGKITSGRHDFILRLTAGMRDLGVPLEQVIPLVRKRIDEECDLSDGRKINDTEVINAYNGIVRQRGPGPSAEESAKVDSIIASLTEPAQEPEEAASTPIGTLPKSIIDGMRGPMLEMWRYCMHAPRPQPEISLAVTLATWGAILGGKVESRTGLRTNVYVVAIADTGAGKDEPRKAAKKVLRAAGQNLLVGADAWSSSTAIHTMLQQGATRICYVDEFGKVVASIADRNAGTHLKEIPNVLLKVSGAANDVYDATAYADSKKNVQIQEPCLCVLGTTTHGPLFSNLTREALEDGLLARCLMLAASNDLPERSRDFLPRLPPEPLVDAVRKWRVGGLETMTAQRIHETKEAGDMLFEYGNQCDDRKRKGKLVTSKLWTRAAAAASKVAMIHACACSDPDAEAPPIIREDNARWAIELVEYCTNYLIAQCDRCLAETGHERDLVDLEKFIRGHGADGVSVADMGRHYRKMPRRRLEELRSELIEQGRIRVFDRHTGTRGRPSVHVAAI